MLEMASIHNVWNDGQQAVIARPVSKTDVEKRHCHGLLGLHYWLKYCMSYVSYQ